MRLAIETASKVHVTYNDGTKVMTQARVEFEYACESVKIESCDPLPEPTTICMTRRFTRCRPNS